MNSVLPVQTLVAPRVAVMIDADNIPRSFRPDIDRQAKALGPVASCQVFGDIALHSDWSKEADLEIHHCSGKRGGNAADIALVIAALDLAYRGLAQAFLIVSRDRDFEPLRRHLIKIGCSATVLKPPAAEVPALVVPAGKTASPVARDEVLAQVIAVIRENGGPQGLPIANLNPFLSRTGFRVSVTPEKTWRGWLNARPAHFVLDPKGADCCVRLVERKAAR